MSFECNPFFPPLDSTHSKIFIRHLTSSRPSGVLLLSMKNDRNYAKELSDSPVSKKDISYFKVCLFKLNCDINLVFNSYIGCYLQFSLIWSSSAGSYFLRSTISLMLSFFSSSSFSIKLSFFSFMPILLILLSLRLTRRRLTHESNMSPGIDSMRIFLNAKMWIFGLWEISGIIEDSKK